MSHLPTVNSLKGVLSNQQIAALLFKSPERLEMGGTPILLRSQVFPVENDITSMCATFDVFSMYPVRLGQSDRYLDTWQVNESL